MLIHLINRPKTVRLEFRKERLLENCCYTGNNVYGVIRNLITKLRPFLKEAKTMELIYLILKNLISTEIKFCDKEALINCGADLRNAFCPNF